MSKEVLLSIKPYWCEKIANNKKIVEIRKTKPKLNTPFKCYVYCTKEKINGELILVKSDATANTLKIGKETIVGVNKGVKAKEDISLSGMVIAEFMCNDIISLENLNADELETVAMNACLNINDILRYGGKFGWCISDLTIYKNPKVLSELGLGKAPQSWCYIE